MPLLLNSVAIICVDNAASSFCPDIFTVLIIQFYSASVLFEKRVLILNFRVKED